ncbi:MAG: hypothetical protein ACLT76_01960 [Clostridium fessum]
MESSSQYTVFSAELSAVDGFSGRILPYVNALDDQKYFVPQLRFSRRRLQRVVCIYADDGPDRGEYIPGSEEVSETIEAIRAAAGVLEKLQLSEADRNGYIFKRLRQCGGAVRMPGTADGSRCSNAYNGPGYCTGPSLDRGDLWDDRRAGSEAARIIRRLLEEAWIVTTGNQTAIEMRSGHRFDDRIRDFRSKMAE